MTIYTMVGLPASGKSTFAEMHPECRIVSTDAIREEMCGDASIQKNNDLIFKTAFRRIAESQTDVIFDATNVTRRARKAIIKRFPQANHVAVFVNTNLEECKRRNQLRARHVPIDVIERMASKLVPPTKEEGFSEIIEINA